MAATSLPGGSPATRTLAIRPSTLLWAVLLLCFLAGLPVLLGATWLSLLALLSRRLRIWKAGSRAT